MRFGTKITTSAVAKERKANNLLLAGGAAITASGVLGLTLSKKKMNRIVEKEPLNGTDKQTYDVSKDSVRKEYRKRKILGL